MKRLAVVVLLVLVASLASGEERRFSVPLGSSPALGPAEAAVTIVEFIDFQ